MIKKKCKNLLGLLVCFAALTSIPLHAETKTIPMAEFDGWHKPGDSVYNPSPSLLFNATGFSARRAFMKFPLGSIPNGATIHSAKLRLSRNYVSTSSASKTLAAYQITSDLSNWFGTGQNIPISSSSSGSILIWSSGNFDLDVTSIVRNWKKNNQPNHGIALMPTSGSGTVGIASRSGGSLRPQLIVDYTPPPTPLVVTAVEINQGDLQRSKLLDIAVAFNKPITAFSAPMRLINLETGDIFNVRNFEIDDRILYADLLAQDFVLPDGNYSMILFGFNIRSIDPPALLDGDFDGQQGGDYLYPDLDLFQFYGDFDGNRVVNLYDFRDFRAAFGTSVGDLNFGLEFDSDFSGTINLYDFRDFRRNFGLTLE